MNQYSGEIERFSNATAIPRGWLVLTDEEAQELAALPNDERLARYIERHANEKCGACGCFIKSHHLNKFKECAANEFARIDAERHEQSMKQFLDSIPVRKLPDAMSLGDELRQRREELMVGK